MEVDGDQLAAHQLGYRAPGTTTLTLTATADARLMLLGGVPFGEEIVMWWNFIGRSHEEIVEYRDDWEALLETGASQRFSLPQADPMGALHAPPMPAVRLRSRR